MKEKETRGGKEGWRWVINELREENQKKKNEKEEVRLSSKNRKKENIGKKEKIQVHEEQY